MAQTIKRIGILTSGGDCSGLNAVIESVVKSASSKNIQVLGFKMGYDGLLRNDYVLLDNASVRNIGHEGGSILGNSNKTNLFKRRIFDEKGEITYRDDSMIAVKNLQNDSVDALVVVGGDGSMTSARDFARLGVNVVCIPKTIDNDVPYTDKTFGYSTAVERIADALSSIKTTGYSHNRVMILEVMGRHAGWLALEGGLSGDADFILLPEIPYNIDHIAEKLIERYNLGFKSTLICVSEGAHPKNGKVTATVNSKYPDSVKLGGVGSKIAFELEEKIKNVTDQEVRCTNLSYIQRGGNTNYSDRILSFRYGSFAVDTIMKGEFGVMVAMRGEKIVTVKLEDVVGNGPMGETSKGGMKNVTEDSDLLRCARSMGVYLGE
ncbi:ATP-dependent 6-phosphofructokinase [bacterium]|nr:ATP-dependent 6-phosphofructokinase [bacterium]